MAKSGGRQMHPGGNFKDWKGSCQRPRKSTTKTIEEVAKGRASGPHTPNELMAILGPR